MPPVLIQNVNVSTAVAPPPPRWQSFHFNVHNFKDLPTAKNHYFETPEFSCYGHQWGLRVYPGGGGEAVEGMVSFFLYLCSEESITVNYEVMIINKVGKNKKNPSAQSTDCFEGKGKGRGWDNFLKRSNILNILDSNGMLTVRVSIEKEPSDADVFVPKNPI